MEAEAPSASASVGTEAAVHGAAQTGAAGHGWGARPVSRLERRARRHDVRRLSLRSARPRMGEWRQRFRRGRFRASGETKTPTPCRVMTSPSARSAEIASRTTVRLTPVALISTCSVGSREPGANFPLSISNVSRFTKPEVRLGAGARGLSKGDGSGMVKVHGIRCYHMT